MRCQNASICSTESYNIRGEIKENGKAASVFCGLQTSTRNRSVTMTEIEWLYLNGLRIAIKNTFP
jgi:hypothetical protein